MPSPLISTKSLTDFAAMLKLALQAVSDQLAAQFEIEINATALQDEPVRVAGACLNKARPMPDMRRQSFERVLGRTRIAPRGAKALLETFVAMRFGAHFEAVILGEANPLKMPEKRSFLAALKTAGEGQPGRMLHVEDSLANDGQGANGAEVGSVWFNPQRRLEHRSQQAAHSLVHLREVLVILNAGVIKDCKAAKAGVEWRLNPRGT